MQQKDNTYITSGMKMSEVIMSNPYFILMLEHFGIDLVVHEKLIDEVCLENNINKEVFLKFANLFNGIEYTPETDFSFDDIRNIINYLKNCHQYYTEEKFPKLYTYIQRMSELNDNSGILLVDKFFKEYLHEVTEHIDYENKIVFPYIIKLHKQLTETKDTQGIREDNSTNDYSVINYKELHSDIEDKLTDLKNLLIKYLPQKNDRQIRRKLLMGLFEVEYDLHIHSQIEDFILIPLVQKMENLANKKQDKSHKK